MADGRSAPAAGAEVRVVTGEDAFAGLRADWEALHARAAAPSLFTTWEWLDAVWQWRRLEAELRVLTVHRDGEWVAAVPLILRRSSWRGMPLRVLEFLDGPDNQDCDVVAAAEHHGAAIEALARWLHGSRAGWHRLSLERLPADSPTPAALCAALGRLGLRCTLKPAPGNHFVDMAGDWAGFYRGRSRRLKKGNNLVANRLAKAGELKLEWIREAADADRALEAVLGISARSWKTRTRTTLDNPGPSAFIRRLTEHALARGWLSVWLLSLDGEVVATEYELLHGGDVHALRADFDHAQGKLSPGTYLNWKVMEQLFEHVQGRYYMGPGSNPYKLRWTEDAVPLVKLVAYGAGMRARAHHLEHEVLRPLAARHLLKGKGGAAPKAGE